VAWQQGRTGQTIRCRRGVQSSVRLASLQPSIPHRSQSSSSKWSPHVTFSRRIPFSSPSPSTSHHDFPTWSWPDYLEDVRCKISLARGAGMLASIRPDQLNRTYLPVCGCASERSLLVLHTYSSTPYAHVSCVQSIRQGLTLFGLRMSEVRTWFGVPHSSYKIWKRRWNPRHVSRGLFFSQRLKVSTWLITLHHLSVYNQTMNQRFIRFEANGPRSITPEWSDADETCNVNVVPNDSRKPLGSVDRLTAHTLWSGISLLREAQ